MKVFIYPQTSIGLISFILCGFDILKNKIYNNHRTFNSKIYAYLSILVAKMYFNYFNLKFIINYRTETILMIYIIVLIITYYHLSSDVPSSKVILINNCSKGKYTNVATLSLMSCCNLLFSVYSYEDKATWSRSQSIPIHLH